MADNIVPFQSKSEALGQGGELPYGLDPTRISYSVPEFCDAIGLKRTWVYERIHPSKRRGTEPLSGVPTPSPSSTTCRMTDRRPSLSRC
jgi:hypothetical protein